MNFLFVVIESFVVEVVVVVVVVEPDFVVAELEILAPVLFVVVVDLELAVVVGVEYSKPQKKNFRILPKKIG